MIDDLITLDTDGDGISDAIAYWDENGLNYAYDTNLDGVWDMIETYSGFDEYGNPLDEVIVTVQDITVKSNEAGNFRLEIPVAKQAKEQLLTAYKPGYERWTFTAPVMSDVPWSIVLKKSSKN